MTVEVSLFSKRRKQACSSVECTFTYAEMQKAG